MSVAIVMTALMSTGCSAPRATPTTGNQDLGVTINTDTPAGTRAQQTLDMLNADWPVGPSIVRTFAVTDLTDSIQSRLRNLWWDRPFTVSSADYAVGKVALHLRDSYGGNQNIEIHTDYAGQVNRFDTELVPPKITSWADVDAELTRSHAKYSYQVAKVDDGRCEPIAGTNTAESLPLASIFKLYVLYAVADATKAGTLSWDEQLTVTSRAKAVDFSALEQYPVGSKISVRSTAEMMISVSSNMATDLLIDRVGTKAVERALVAAGHHDPQSMTPFPTMHDLFTIGWGLPDLRQEWKDAVAIGVPSARARLVDEANSLPYRADPERLNSPASLYGVEWYGSAEDICRVSAALHDGAVGAAAPVTDITSMVPGIVLDGQQWPYVSAKGGNLPGDLTFSWYAVDRSGQAWAVSFQLNWPQYRGPTAGAWLISIAQQVFAMVHGPS